jgi:protein TonB
VIAEIERTIKAASPFPAPVRMGKVVYTDTWLCHKSGKFQLDTLTEGQN